MTYLLALIPLLVSALEAISYLGFFALHTGVSAYFLYALIPLIFLLAKPRFPKLIILLLRVGSCLTAFTLFALELAENFTYPNFVFTYTHIHLIGLQVFAFLIWFVYLLTHMSQDKNSLAKSSLLAALICLFALHAGRTTAYAAKQLLVVIKDPLASYDTKMARVYPGFYEAMQLVKQITPANARIIIPPQGNPWEMEGNGAIMTYFLYPRRIVPSSLTSPFPKGDYALIAKGSWVKRGDVDYGWPKVEVKAKRLWEFNINDITYKELNGNYDPKTHVWDWGLIEVDNE